MKKYEYFKKYVDYVREKDIYPVMYKVEGPSSSPEIIVDGKKFLTFSSNNYLSLARNKEVINETSKALKKYGVGSGSTRLLLGSLDVQGKFEEELAKYIGHEDSITFSSGFLANVGVIRSLVDPFPHFLLGNDRPGIVLSDELNHASIIDGVRLAKSDHFVYKHKDVNDLEKCLKENKKERALIITDGIFSMDGDLAPLKEIVDVAKKYDALIMVDDSHGVGVMGKHGRGTSEYLGVNDDVDVVMGSFTKAFGSIGGFITSKKLLGDYLRITARSYIFSDPILPAVVSGLRKALELVENSDERRSKIFANVKYFKSSLDKLGFKTLGGETSIVPVLMHSWDNAIKFSRELYAMGIVAPPITKPAVNDGDERIRISIMAAHERAHVDKLTSAFEEIGKKLKLI